MNAAPASRGLGLWSATALVISNTVAVGILHFAGLALMLLGLPVSRMLVSSRSTPVLP